MRDSDCHSVRCARHLSSKRDNLCHLARFERLGSSGYYLQNDVCSFDHLQKQLQVISHFAVDERIRASRPHTNFAAWKDPLG